MFLDDIRLRVRKHPFEPFRIYVSDGSHYDVLHHDFVLLTARYVTVALGVAKSDDYPDRVVDIDPSHITRLEPLRNRRGPRRARRAGKT